MKSMNLKSGSWKSLWKKRNMKSVIWIWSLSGSVKKPILKSVSLKRRRKDSEAILPMKRFNIENKLKASSPNSTITSIPKFKTSKSSILTKSRLLTMKIPNWKKSSTLKTNKLKASYPKTRKLKTIMKTHWACSKDKMKTSKTKWSSPSTSTTWNLPTWKISSTVCETQNWVCLRTRTRTNSICSIAKSTNSNKLSMIVQEKCKTS